MPYTFSFNGITKDYVYMLRGRKRSAWAPRSLNLLTVPRKPGAYLQGVETSVREIEVPIGLVAESIGDLQKMKEDLAAWLVTDEPKELIFDDEPDRIYYAIVDETLDLEEIARIGQGTIRFICPDPYKYGFEKEASFPSDVVSLNYEGTAPGDPVFELEVTDPVTFAMIQNQDEEYMMIGRPAEVTTPIVNTKTLLLYENGETIDSWTPATPEMEGGSQGTIGYDGAGITAPNYGTGTGYHGPSVFKEVPPTQDFEIELRGQLYTDHVNQTGRFGFFLFDEQMRQIAFMAAIDNSQYVNRKLAEGRIGPYIGDFKNYIVSSRNYQKDWDNFPAYLRLRRTGDKYEFYVARVLGDGTHFEPLTASWTVFEDKFRGRLRYVGVFIDKYGNTASPHTNRIDYIRVNAITQAAEDQTPYIAYPGDVITFDHQNSDILLNGESRMDLKQFGASFFKLKPGQNQFVVMPDNNFNVKVRFKERFL
ncbi:distal tail protein Dit [Geobacillus thermodenitrificans]|uniref:distal tail protein Dit n=1 Tax=Geobacillus thermodenitrificans TaxID=33940 RepID=UPI003D22E09D